MLSRFSYRARVARRGLVAAGLVSLAAASGGVSTASAVPVSITLDYTCNFPLLQPQPLKLVISSDIPATIPQKTGTGAFPITASAQVSEGAAAGLQAVGTTTVEGSAAASARITLPNGKGLDLSVPTVIDSTPVPATGAFTTTATGKTPSLSFADAGTATIAVGDVVLTLSPKLADGTVTGLDTFETECFQKPGQNNTLAKIVVGTPPPVDKAYALGGTATIKTLVKGSLPLSGSVVQHSAAATGPFTADLTLNPTSGNLTALGFLPVTATVALVPTEQVTGTYDAGVLNAVAKVRVKLPSIKTFGIQLAGGANCQATQVSNIPLKSTGTYDPAVGGTITGTFSISNLSGCGALTGIISPLTAGGGNAIALKLTPKSVA